MQQVFTNKYIQWQGGRLASRLTPVGDGVEQRSGHVGELVELVVRPGYRLAHEAPECCVATDPGVPVSSSSARGGPALRRHVPAHDRITSSNTAPCRNPHARSTSGAPGRRRRPRRGIPGQGATHRGQVCGHEKVPVH